MDDIKKKNKRLLIKLTLGVLFMFGFCYMMVPLYTLVCKQLGINGKVYQVAESAHIAVDTSRSIRLEFSTSIQGTLPWQFEPVVRHVDIHPGETKEVFFFAENDSGHDMTVQAIPSIAPSEAAQYIKKTQCFCFTQQTLSKDEKVDMPVIFHIDPDLPKYIHEITLNYTLFDATKFIKKQKHFTTGRIEL